MEYIQNLLRGCKTKKREYMIVSGMMKVYPVYKKVYLGEL
jgi:hypothetical protein